MNVGSINNAYQNHANLSALHDEGSDAKTALKKMNYTGHAAQSGISFKGSAANAGKRFWLIFRRISDYMKKPDEMVNAGITAIGTGIIAPFAIMASPSKGENAHLPKEQQREKKKFQALRQPVSAILAFGFQAPTIIGIKRGLDKLAYEKQIDFFKDEVGQVIPDKKYLKRQAKKALNNNASENVKNNWSEELKLVSDEALIKSELKQKIQKEYSEVGIEISEAELEKMASNPKKLESLMLDKMADAKHENLLNNKVNEYLNHNLNIQDLDLVTEDYKDLAKLRNKAEFKAIEQKAKLSPLDKFIKAMGLTNKKIKQMEAETDALAKEKGLQIMKEELQDGFKDKKFRVRKFVENKNGKAQKHYANKVFWIQLLVNLGMVAISCVVLNWVHPKFAAWVEHRKEKKDAQKAQKQMKVEVRA